jgi:hypothetical protein
MMWKTIVIKEIRKGNKMKDYNVTVKFENGSIETLVVKNVSNPFSAMSIAKKCKVQGRKVVASSAFPVKVAN